MYVEYERLLLHTIKNIVMDQGSHKILKTIDKMVRAVGIEPTLPCEKRILSPLRLPFRHARWPLGCLHRAAPGRHWRKSKCLPAGGERLCRDCHALASFAQPRACKRLNSDGLAHHGCTGCRLAETWPVQFRPAGPRLRVRPLRFPRRVRRCPTAAVPRRPRRCGRRHRS